MSYGTYGFDPAMANDADRIFMLVVDTMFNQGQIDANVMNVLKGQYGTYRNSIISDVVTKASQAGRTPDQQMIQESIHGFITNVIQSYANRAPMGYGGYGPGYGQPNCGGYGPGYGQPTYGGYGQPAPYAGYQVGTLYSNPRYHVGQPGYAPAPQYTGYQGGYRGYVPQNVPQASASAAVTASRYTSTAEPPPPPMACNNVVEQPKQEQEKVEYNAPMVLDTKEIRNDMLAGTKKIVRIGADRMADIFVGKLSKPVMNFREFVKRMTPLITSKNQFVMAAVQIPKLLKAKAVEVNALLQKMATFLGEDMQTNGNSLESVPARYKKFYAEWIKESGDAHKELTRVLVNEFNHHASCGYLFKDGTGHIEISGLDDIFELMDTNTEVQRVREWQQSPDYMNHLSGVIYHAIFGLFLGRDNYRTTTSVNPEDNRLIASIFSDLTVDNFMVKDSFAAMTKAITNAKIDPNTATAIPALNTTINEHAVILVPRIFVYTNLAPAGFVTGDYADPRISREVATVSNVLEDYLVAGYKTLNTNGATPVVQGVVCSGSMMVGFNVGTNTSKHLFIGPSLDPVIVF